MKNYSYETLSEALKDLKRRGYTADFKIGEGCIECESMRLAPEEFEVSEFYRFEGMTNPDDEEVVYAIISKNGIKGTLVDAFGIYSDDKVQNLIRKLRIRR